MSSGSMLSLRTAILSCSPVPTNRSRTIESESPGRPFTRGFLR